MAKGMCKKILLIEDNPDIAHLLRLHLTDQHMHVEHRAEGDSGLEEALRGRYDLIILDLMLPGLDGIEVCRRLRAEDAYIPILMLTAKSAELDRVLGLEIGADDYLTKPFSIPEMIARVKAILRRVDALGAASGQVGSEVLGVGELELDPDRRQVTRRDQAVELTAKEFDLLWHFARHPGRVYTRAQLLDQVWGYGHDGYEHTVNSHINRLRAKIEADPAHPEYVLTVWGIGYKFTDSGALRSH